MTQNNLESITQFHKQRGNCDCIPLMDLWEQMQVLDKLALECTRDARKYTQEKEKLEKDEKWMTNFRYRLGRFHEENEKYRSLFLEKTKKGHILINSDDNMKCSSCNTKIPHLHYEGWNE